MSPSERRQRLLEVLCVRRQDTYSNLAQEFQVSQRTIRYDVEALMCSYPIYQSVSASKALNAEQIDLLVRLKSQVSGKDADVLDSILNEFAS